MNFSPYLNYISKDWECPGRRTNGSQNWTRYPDVKQLSSTALIVNLKNISGVLTVIGDDIYERVYLRAGIHGGLCNNNIRHILQHVLVLAGLKSSLFVLLDIDGESHGTDHAIDISILNKTITPYGRTMLTTQILASRRIFFYNGIFIQLWYKKQRTYIEDDTLLEDSLTIMPGFYKRISTFLVPDQNFDQLITLVVFYEKQDGIYAGTEFIHFRKLLAKCCLMFPI